VWTTSAVSSPGTGTGYDRDIGIDGSCVCCHHCSFHSDLCSLTEEAESSIQDTLGDRCAPVQYTGQRGRRARSLNDPESGCCDSASIGSVFRTEKTDGELAVRAVRFAGDVRYNDDRHTERSKDRDRLDGAAPGLRCQDDRCNIPLAAAVCGKLQHLEGVDFPRSYRTRQPQNQVAPWSKGDSSP